LTVLGDRWGVTADEVSLPYPCDDIVGSPTLQVWRGVTVQASPSTVWAWVTQIQLAPYSYDLIDNMGHRSPRQLLDVATPRPGQPFTRTGNRPQGRVLSLEPGVHYTGSIMSSAMSYVLVPIDDGRATRLLLKVVMRVPRWVVPALSLGDLVMARRQLLNLKRLAEHSPDST
jgi:hypothetical protein